MTQYKLTEIGKYWNGDPKYELTENGKPLQRGKYVSLYNLVKKLLKPGDTYQEYPYTRETPFDAMQKEYDEIERVYHQ